MKVCNVIINKAVPKGAGYKGRINTRLSTWKKVMVKGDEAFNEHSTRAMTLTELEGILHEAMCGRISTIFLCSFIL